jgi:hypothetical protein
MSVPPFVPAVACAEIVVEASADDATATTAKAVMLFL